MWEDLFRAAAGEDDVAETPAPTIETEEDTRKRQSSTNSESQSRKKRRNKSKNKQIHRSSQELLESVLESRTDAIDRQLWLTIPTWLSPGSSLCNSELCSGWEQENACPLDNGCRNCGRSILYHSLAVEPSVARQRNSIRKVLTAFALVRDIRCCCSCFLSEFYGLKGGRKSISNLEGYTISATTKSTELVRVDFSAVLNPGEADILMEKFRKIKRAANALYERVHHLSKQTKKSKRRFKSGDLFDRIVRLIICCDAAYFRLYYLQNSGNLPIENEKAFLPHPPTYFGSKNIAWDVFDHTTDLLKTTRQSNSHFSDDRWDDLVKEVGIAPSSLGLDPLSFMQRNRLSESILLFQKTSWTESKEVKNQFMESIKHQSKGKDPESLFYTTHETPAPAILQEWRDSCRDFLCNLYAYASLCPTMVDEIKETLQDKRFVCKSILEIGAGTGYVANLLGKAGLTLTAFDVAPTTENGNYTPNEYHGSSPSFIEVEYANSRNLGSIFSERKAKETALLLCYPPPLSDMAETSLKSFVNHGGKIVIHIGEFSGLTGSTKFEKFLSCKFDQQYRRRCLNWGSDAAEVSIWTKSEQSEQQTQEFLVKCSQSKTTIATRRLRICRPLSYSTASSFDAHKVERGVHFTFNMIPEGLNTSDIISFDARGEKYFKALPSKHNP